ncbi:MAG TPA: hypothetical protein VM661_17515 [Candidatus Sulfotelmatobacter sp.]|jgi:flagellar basal body-associated protein FliL|nr:hypothetical protein [Candidatus Sulfotelmatobacter sp.]
MKKLIVIILVLLLLVGGGLGVMTFLGKGPFAAMLAEQQKKKAEEEAKAAAEAPPPPTVFFDLGTFIIPVVQKRNIVKQVGLDMEIEVEVRVQAKVAAEMPRLQNSVNLDLYDTVPNHMDVRNPADKEAIRQHLIALGNKEFGEGAVHDVVIKSMYYR